MGFQQGYLGALIISKGEVNEEMKFEFMEDDLNIGDPHGANYVGPFIRRRESIDPRNESGDKYSA